MNAHLTTRLIGVAVTFGVLSAVAQIREAPASAGPSDTTRSLGLAVEPALQGKAKETNHQHRDASRRMIEGILKLSDAGVSKEVIKAYIESTPIYYTLNAEDLIELKQHAVPDELTLSLLKKGAELHANAKKRASSSAGGAQAATFARSPLLDPESYDYFQYYYLFPRTLAAANERLRIYSPPAFNGYYPSYWSGPQGPRRMF